MKPILKLMTMAGVTVLCVSCQTTADRGGNTAIRNADERDLYLRDLERSWVREYLPGAEEHGWRDGCW
jgi:hypothetical protein